MLSFEILVGLDANNSHDLVTNIMPLKSKTPIQ